MGRELHIDFETRSACDLTKAGADIYSSHPTTDVLCMAYCFDDDPVEILTRRDFHESKEILEHVASGGLVVGHNVGGFEILIWNAVMSLKYGWPEMKIEQLQDNMAEGYLMGMPGKLEELSLALGLEFLKDMKGHRIMMQLSKPRSIAPDGTPIFWEEADVPEKFQALYNYCINDVVVERECGKRLMRLSEYETKIWQLDWKINRRGIMVDLDMIFKAIQVVNLEKKRLDVKMRKITGNQVAMCSAVSQLTDWLKAKGLEVPSIAKAEVTELLSNPDLPKDARTALEYRQQAGQTATSKFNTMITGAGVDQRMRGLFQYSGAGTGRWAGRRVQLQNLKRPDLDQPAIERVIEVVESYSTTEAIDIVELIYGPPISVMGDLVRAALIARPGCKLIGCDFSSIEARVLAWLTGEDHILEIFRGHGKIYEYAAAAIYKIKMELVTKAQRQIGKVSELALGYGGGKGAFQTMAANYGVKVTDEEAEVIKQAWRESRPKTVKYWYAVEERAIAAVMNPGHKFSAGPTGREVTFLKRGSFLWCRLPSGLALCYPYPKIETVLTPWGQEKQALTYMGVDTYTKKWSRMKTYGGSLVENITQSVARCALSDSLIRLEEANYPVVLHVHDEAVVEVPESYGSPEDVERIMSIQSEWAKGLPIAAAGWQGKRFRK